MSVAAELSTDLCGVISVSLDGEGNSTPVPPRVTLATELGSVLSGAFGTVGVEAGCSRGLWQL